MRADRGFWCLPEIDLGIAIPNGMGDMMESRLPAQTYLKAVISCHRFGGEEALSAGIVDRALTADAILPAALELGEKLASKRGPLLSSTKKYVHRNVVQSLTTFVVPHPLEKR